MDWYFRDVNIANYVCNWREEGMVVWRGKVARKGFYGETENDHLVDIVVDGCNSKIIIKEI